jgi:replicative DNA helicase
VKQRARGLHKQTPAAIESEKIVLGTALRFTESLPDIVAALPTEDFFYNFNNRTLYAAILYCYEHGGIADIATVVQRLRDTVEMDKAGGIVGIEQLRADIISLAPLKHHLDILVSSYQRRELIRQSELMAAKASDPNISPETIMSFGHAAIDGIADCSTVSKHSSIKESIASNLDDIRLYQSGLMADRIVSTGLHDLDKMVEIRDGSVTVIAARPSMGKTALALTITGNVAGVLRRQVDFYSLEMPAQELTMRMVCQRAKISANKIKRKDGINEDEMFMIEHSAQEVAAMPIAPFDIGYNSWPKMRAEILRCKRTRNTRLVVVDYLQLMDNQTAGDNRNLEIGSITRDMKAVAKEVGVPIILLSQLSRNTEQRKEKKPVLSDLRDSGSIEQDADNVIFIHRDRDSITELLVAKQRNGPTGEVPVYWDASLARFANLAYK